MHGEHSPDYRDLSYPRDMVGASLKLADSTWHPDGTWTVVDYAHIIGRGEEAFLLELNSANEVIGRCVAFSQHSWWLARLLSGPARIVQRWATKRYVQGMGRDLVNVV